MGDIKKSAWRLVCAAAVSGLAAAHAGDGVLVAIPGNVDKASALAAAKDSLLYREWKIVAEDADSVTATISRANVDARIRIAAKGSSLVYDESATGRPKFDHTGRMTATATTTPTRWIEYLRADATERLLARAGAPAPAAAPPAKADATASSSAVAPVGGRSSVQRLAELKEMLDRGLITSDEYARKKEEILKAL